MKVALAQGRMNPPTKGHIYLLSKLLEQKSDRYILVLQGNNLQDKKFKNIFEQSIKEDIIKASDLKEISKLEVLNGYPYIPDLCKELNLTEKDEIVLFLGEEDKNIFDNQIEVMHFDESMPNITVEIVVMKKETKKERISGTLVREFIFKNDFEGYFKHSAIKDKEKALEMFNLLREGIISNLKTRFKVEESDNQLNIKLPRTKSGKLTSYANIVLENIQHLVGFDKELVFDWVQLPPPGDEVTYIDLPHSIGLNKSLVQSFKRPKEIRKSEYIDTDGKTCNRTGNYSDSMWSSLNRSIRNNGIIDPVNVRVNDDFSCCINKGHHRLYATDELGKDYPKQTIPVKLSLHPSISFKALNSIFKSWNDVGIVDNKDYSNLLNQLNFLQVEKHIQLPDKIVLNESGKFGHMNHGYDVFKGKDIFKFFDNIFSDKYDAVEKVDGLNVCFGIDENDQVFFDCGGEDGIVNDISDKYSLFHPAGDAYRAGTESIKQGLERTPPAYLRALGLFNGNTINCEVIYGEIPNVVPYSKSMNYIVFHGIMGPEPVKNEKKLLNSLASHIGTVIVTSPVVNYEGEDLTKLKASVSQESSTWKFTGPIKIDQEKMKEQLGDIVERWRDTPEALKLAKEDNLTEEEAAALAKSLSVKISSSILNRMVSQLRDGDKLPNTLGIEGIAFYDNDNGDVFKLTGDFSKLNKDLWGPIDKLRAIEREFFRFVAQDVLGLKTVKVGKDLISRFDSNTSDYLKKKSKRFANRRSNVNNQTPEDRVNIYSIMHKIDDALDNIQRFYEEAKQLDTIKRDSIMQSTKATAFKILRVKNYIKNAKDYNDVAAAAAKGQGLMESSFRNEVKSKILEL